MASIFLLLAFFLLPPNLLTLSFASESCPFSQPHHHQHHHHDNHHQRHHHDREIHSHSQQDLHDFSESDDHGHSHGHDHDHGLSHSSGTHGSDGLQGFRLPEEVAEEEDLRMYGFTSHALWEEEQSDGLTTIGLWVRAMGCSLLVSLASLICLVLLPLIVYQGKPSQIVVDALAAFGAGAMLGDAFLHQLPHALGAPGGHSHSHDEHSHAHSHSHDHFHNHFHTDAHVPVGDHGHAHSIQDLSVGLAVLAGIILFFIVEKIVRQVEELSVKGTHSLGHSHNHHHHHHHHRRHGSYNPNEGLENQDVMDKDSSEARDNMNVEAVNDSYLSDENTDELVEKTTKAEEATLRNRVKKVDAEAVKDKETTPLIQKDDLPGGKGAALSYSQASTSNLVLGYLNLFSDGVHNFTDGMALGSAFLLHGTIGGWSRTLFLLAHELPQEVGDFGILVRSGFGIYKALAFNFLSALLALAGTALALLVGGSRGKSSWIEGFTAGGFIYIAVAGVLPEMHLQGTTVRTTAFQLVSLCLGMGVALGISLVE